MMATTNMKGPIFRMHNSMALITYLIILHIVDSSIEI